MAEIRKHHPQESAIGRAVREAMGESVQPVIPGEPAAADPFDSEATPSGTANTVPGAASLPTTFDQQTGWLLLDAQQVQAISAPIRDQASPTLNLTDDPEADWQDTDDPDAGVV
jgi:hypothetical protein